MSIRINRIFTRTVLRLHTTAGVLAAPHRRQRQGRRGGVGLFRRDVLRQPQERHLEAVRGSELIQGCKGSGNCELIVFVHINYYADIIHSSRVPGKLITYFKLQE